MTYRKLETRIEIGFLVNKEVTLTDREYKAVVAHGQNLTFQGIESCNDVDGCLVVINGKTNNAFLIDSQGYEYARYTYTLR